MVDKKKECAKNESARDNADLMFNFYQIFQLYAKSFSTIQLLLWLLFLLPSCVFLTRRTRVLPFSRFLVLLLLLVYFVSWFVIEGKILSFQVFVGHVAPYCTQALNKFKLTCPLTCESNISYFVR